MAESQKKHSRKIESKKPVSHKATKAQRKRLSFLMVFFVVFVPSCENTTSYDCIKNGWEKLRMELQ
jgi:hypothetical protein